MFNRRFKENAFLLKLDIFCSCNRGLRDRLNTRRWWRIDRQPPTQSDDRRKWRAARYRYTEDNAILWRTISTEEGHILWEPGLSIRRPVKCSVAKQNKQNHPAHDRVCDSSSHLFFFSESKTKLVDIDSVQCVKILTPGHSMLSDQAGSNYLASQI